MIFSCLLSMFMLVSEPLVEEARNGRMRRRHAMEFLGKFRKPQVIMKTSSLFRNIHKQQVQWIRSWLCLQSNWNVFSPSIKNKVWKGWSWRCDVKRIMCGQKSIIVSHCLSYFNGNCNGIVMFPFCANTTTKWL